MYAYYGCKLSSIMYCLEIDQNIIQHYTLDTILWLSVLVPINSLLRFFWLPTWFDCSRVVLNEFFPLSINIKINIIIKSKVKQRKNPFALNFAIIIHGFIASQVQFRKTQRAKVGQVCARAQNWTFNFTGHQCCIPWERHNAQYI